MKPVTIDKLKMSDHVRWAQDQEGFDVSFVAESTMVGSHSAIMGTSAIYASKFDELFELQMRNLPWATFAPPVNFRLFSKRFFSYRLFPHIDWQEEDEEKEDDNKTGDLIQQVLDQHEEESKDKMTVLSLLESIKMLNEMLGHINSRKLQYQKG